jgi:hypothetical protein
MPGLLSNPFIGTEITIDIDRFCDEWLIRGGYAAALTRIEDIKRMIDPQVTAYYRESSGQHIHLKIVFSRPITMLDSLVIRAYFADDLSRLTCDMIRYLTFRDIRMMGRCFDQKGIAGKVASAGRWIELVDPEEWDLLSRTDLQSRMHWIEIVDPARVFSAMAGIPHHGMAIEDTQMNLPQS